MVPIDILQQQLFVFNSIDVYSYRPNSVGEHSAADRCPRAMPNYILHLNQ
jgi:hypothetical protein